MAGERGSWTVMVYMAGDNNLSEASVRDLKELASVGPSGEVRILVEHDTAGDGPTYRYDLSTGAGDGELPAPVEDLGETDSGDPATLRGFVEWAWRRYPAEHTMLVLWGHGRSWQPEAAQKLAGGDGTVAAAAIAGAEDDEVLTSTLFRGTVKTMLDEAMESERSICSDAGTGNALDAHELASVLQDAAAGMGQAIDVLGMDACLMCSIEMAYELRGSVGYLVGSEDLVPNAGWPYDRVLKRLVEEPSTSPEMLARHAAQQYVKRYVGWGYDGAVTLAAMNLSRVERVTGPLAELADALVAHMPAAAKEIFDAQQVSTYFWHATLWDIDHFCAALQQRTADEAVRKAAGRVRAAVSPGIDSFVIEQRASGHKVAECGGLTVYLRPYRKEISSYYDRLAFANDTRWLEMMRAYHAAE